MTIAARLPKGFPGEVKINGDEIILNIEKNKLGFIPSESDMEPQEDVDIENELTLYIDTGILTKEMRVNEDSLDFVLDFDLQMLAISNFLGETMEKEQEISVDMIKGIVIFIGIDDEDEEYVLLANGYSNRTIKIKVVDTSKSDE